jgi:2-phospho-L-lactate guanylyltransferase
VATQGGQAILVVPGDLPRLELSDLQEIIRLGQPWPSVVIAPCHRRDGTNALLLRPPGLIEFAFGPESFVRHQQAARVVGIEPFIYHSPTVALDVDVPADLTAWQDRSLIVNGLG